jgi:hypothetical protein
VFITRTFTHPDRVGVGYDLSSLTGLARRLFLGLRPGRIDAEIPGVGVDAIGGHFDEGVFARFEGRDSL